MRESGHEGSFPGGSGTVEAMAGADAEETTVVDESRVFGDIVGKIKQAVREEVAERPRQGLPIVCRPGQRSRGPRPLTNRTYSPRRADVDLAPERVPRSDV